MRIVFFHSDKPREVVLAEAFASGARLFGDEVQLRQLTADYVITESYDVACMVGVKSRQLFWNHWREGIHTVYFDKGYTRHTIPGPIKLWEYWRVAIDSHSPVKQLSTAANPSDRLDKLGLEVLPWRRRGDKIIFAGSSEKYHNFYGLKDPTRFAAKVLSRIKQLTDREVVYRPKPSWREAVPIDGAEYSTADDSIYETLRGAHVLITHGSNACFESVMLGVPCIILGEGVAKPISSTNLEDVLAPRLASDDDKNQWLSNLMYCQWKMSEMVTGEAWNHLRPQIFGA